MRHVVLVGCVLMAWVGTARAVTGGKTAVIYNALGGAQNGGDSFASGGAVLLDEVKNETAATLQSVKLTVMLVKADLGSFRVVGTPVKSTGLPGRIVTLAVVSDKSLTPGKFTDIAVTPSTTVTLEAGTAYFVGIAKVPGSKSSITLGNTLSAAVLGRKSVVAGGYYYNNGGLQANSGGPYQIEVTVTEAQ